jgi:prepilin-type N-terminal cleavage/methylation domain-containing protein
MNIARAVLACRKTQNSLSNQDGFTLVEVMVALLILGVALSGILGVYVQCAIRTDWSATSVAAQFEAQSGLEQCRAAKFDPAGNPPIDELVGTNFPNQVHVLDIGTGSGTSIYGTNTITIQTLSTNPPLKLLRVDCTWSSRRGVLFTNSAITYRAADQ